MADRDDTLTDEQRGHVRAFVKDRLKLTEKEVQQRYGLKQPVANRIVGKKLGRFGWGTVYKIAKREGKPMEEIIGESPAPSADALRELTQLVNELKEAVQRLQSR